MVQRDGEIFYGNGYKYFYCGLALTDNPALCTYYSTKPIVQISGNGFTVYYTVVLGSNWSYIVRSNDNGQVYHYIAIG